MALFKIFKGNQTNKLTDSTVEGYRIPQDGYAYYDTSTRKFYIDADYENNKKITRQPINAEHADSATLSQVAIYETTSEEEDGIHLIRDYYAHSLGITSNNELYLKNGAGNEIIDETEDNQEILNRIPLGARVTIYEWASS